jgi:hypothetical protein
MKIPKYVKDHIRKMSDLARKQKIMNNQLTTYLEKLGVDMDCGEFEDVFAYVEGDCCPEILIDYLGEL